MRKVQLFAQVIIDISHQRIDHPFTYRIPETLREKVRIGDVVQVPFGKGNSLRRAYVLHITDNADVSSDKIKEIHSVLSVRESDTASVVTGRQIALAAWMQEQYGSTMASALKCVVTGERRGKGKEEKEIVLLLSEEEAKEALSLYEKKHQVARARLIRELIEAPRQPYSIITSKLHIPPATLRALKEQGVIEVRSFSRLRDPVSFTGASYALKTLSAAQQSIVDHVIADFDAGISSTSLIHGITGSGKTEVYISIIGKIVERKKSAIMLIPEIALTYQTLLRFYARFGNRVSVVNSSLSEAEKRDQFERALKREIDVIIGPRSALFTPFPNIGAILIDEEHETSYKNEQMPKYHAREVTMQLAKMHGAVVVLGSATPSVTSFDRARSGEYKLYTLQERPTGGSLAKVRIADMRRELQDGNRAILSRALSERIADRLAKKEQVMLFLNRRGYAAFVSCRECGYVAKCPHCEVALSHHRKKGKDVLRCHYCGYETAMMKICPDCGSKYIAGFRAGTEQIETFLREAYPSAKILRMDADTTAKKGEYERILSSFAAEEADILVGTQMIVKGHDFPKVTLVGVLLADLSLYAGDYTGAEKTFDLLTQAAGRAGRGGQEGEVIIQTYQPENYAIVHAAEQDYEGFYEEEIEYRRLLLYPPASHMLSVQFFSRSEDACLTRAGEVRQILEEEKTFSDLILIGPAAAGIVKIKDTYRYALYLKDAKYDTLVQCRKLIEEKLPPASGKEVLMQYDFDPVYAF
ncbi:MAG: primosomal protein N' [Lachnospiraceae bacterium]|nr:primosomal protein N' [Lachnospiraceae bacterium]